jgi:hypothetical protein
MDRQIQGKLKQSPSAKPEWDFNTSSMTKTKRSKGHIVNLKHIIQPIKDFSLYSFTCNS